MLTNTNEWDYLVGLRDLEAVGVGTRLKNKVATIDEVTGDILGVVSRNYKPIQNKTVVEVMQEVSRNLGLTLDKITVVKDKSGAIFKYGFSEERNLEVTTSKEPRDIVSFGIEIFNSFDSTLGSSRMQAFANRLSCLNGMTIPNEIGRLYFTDFEDFIPRRISERISTRLEPICGVVKTWENWATTIPDRIKVGEFIVSGLPKEAGSELLNLYDQSVDKSLWYLYNLVTYHITHEVQTENPKNLRLKQYQLESLANKFYTEELV